MNKWNKKEDKYWTTEWRYAYPFTFRISRSKYGHGNLATIELPSHNLKSGEEKEIDELKKHFDVYIDNIENQEKRMKQLEMKIEELEKRLNPYFDYQI